MKKGIGYIICLLLIGWFWSCSTQKNTKISRTYHALNSRFNIYFNGKTSFDEALLEMQNGYQESYAEMIQMFPISAQPKDKEKTGGPFDRAIEKGNKAIKMHSIKTKPAKKSGWKHDPKQRAFQEQEEYNPFLKKCWLLIGQAQFYNADFLQSSATFSYIARHYATDVEVVTAAKLWQARCYSEIGWFYEAEDILNKLNKEGIPKKNLDFYATVYADYLVKNKNYEEAVPYFKTAIKAEKNGRQRARMKYLLGQLYAAQDQPGLAYQMYKQVIRANPPYELEFAARIRQTEVLTGVDDQKVIKILNRMAKSEKNKEMLDQVYYALGNVYMQRKDTLKAIDLYQLGIDKSVKNGLEKAICQIRLGDIYFQRKDYIKAQPCFSGALSGIQKEFKDYDRIAKLSAVLDELVVHAESVHLQDSLQTLAKMPEKERLAVIDKIIEQVKKEEKEAADQEAKENYLAEQEAKGTGIDRPDTQTKPVILPTPSGKEAGFYFYNPQIVSQGKAAFQRKWGRRPNEDNWRRRKKEMSTFNENGEGQMPADSLHQMGVNGEDGAVASNDSIEKVAVDDPHQREYYIQQLPMKPEDVEASNIIIIDGLYNMSMIYKDKLEDFHLSVESFENLNTRFPANKYKLESYYQLYLLGLRYKDQVLAAKYKDKLIAEFPQSDYAVAIADPDYEYHIRTMDAVQDSLYEKTYQHYLAEDTVQVRRNYEMVTVKYPLASLMPKFMFLNALTYVQAGDTEGFKKALKALIDKYPQADVTALAGEMLKGVLSGRALVQGGIKGMEWNLRFGLGKDGVLTASDSARVFKAEENAPHKLLLMYPTGSLDRNQLLFAVAAYNFSNFMVKQFDLVFEEAGPMSMLSIKGFVNLEEIVHYYKMIYGKDGYATLLDKNVIILPISEDNNETLMHGKTLDEYIQFFNEHFNDKLPELWEKWNIRKESLSSAVEEDQEVKKKTSPDKEEKSDTIVKKEKEEVSVPANVTDTVPAEVKDTVPELVKDTILPVLDTVPRLDTVPVLNKPLKETPVDSIVPELEEDSVKEKNPIPVQKVKEAEIDKDSISSSPVYRPEKPKKLTLKDIEEIRRQEALKEEARKEEERQKFEKEQEEEKQLQEKHAIENEKLIKQQKEEEEQLLKAKEDREKQLEKARKDKLKQRQAELKAKEKAQKELRKQKEQEYKARLKAKEKERAQKEKEYKQKLKAKEKAYKEARKAKEKARRKR